MNETDNGAAGPPDAPQEASPGTDSSTFTRCAECAHASDVDVSAGTLLCKKHSMHVNAEADEIPDDCVDYETRPDGAKHTPEGDG